MKVLDKGFVELVDMMPHHSIGVSGDLAIVNAARTSYLGESKGAEADRKLLEYLMYNGHTTPFEMVQFKFLVKAPIFVVRQWMRHRTWSYNEQSRRYSDDEPEFYIPGEYDWRLQSTTNKQGSAGMAATYTPELEVYCRAGLDLYNQALADGVAREQARMFLPVNMYTTFIGSVDAHNLMGFMRQRMSEHAQYEIRVYAQAIYTNFFKPALPWTAAAFESAEARGKLRKED